MQRVIIIVIPLIILGLAIIFLPTLQPTTEEVDTVAMEQQCDSACQNLIVEYRTNPSDEVLWLSDFCTLNFDTSAVGGRFVDHCYGEDSDIIERSCLLAKLDSTTLLINGSVCR